MEGNTLIGDTVIGKEGSIKIEELGAVIGQFTKWMLAREKKNEEVTLTTFRFTGTLQYVNPSLFNDPDYVPVVIITTDRDRRTKKPNQYRLEQAEGATRSLDGRSLLLEGVTLCRL
jgi:hypothetical protein